MAKTFKEMREAVGASQEHLARQIGVSLSTIRWYDQGVRDISTMKFGTAMQLCKLLHCTPEELLESSPGRKE